MVEKLKLVRERTPWSLVAKAVLFGLSWLYFPYLLFIGIATYLFLSPPFQAVRFAPFFLLLAWFGMFFNQSFPVALLLSFLFFLLLGMKNLVFIDRVLVAESFLITVSFLLWYSLFSSLLWPSFSFFIVLIGVLLMHLLLLRIITRFEERRAASPGSIVLSLVFVFLSFELAWLLSLLPIKPVFQSLLSALLTGLFLELYGMYIEKNLSETKLTRIALVSGGVIVLLVLCLPFSLSL